MAVLFGARRSAHPQVDVRVASPLLSSVEMRWALIGMIPFEALRSAAAGRFEAENLSAIEAGVDLAG